MRLNQSESRERHANWLLEIGAGTNMDVAETVLIPDSMICPNNSVDSLISSIYPGINHGNHPDSYFLDRSILCCRNDEVVDMNNRILNLFPGQEHVLMSADSIHVQQENADGDRQIYPTEYLNSLNCSGMPLAKLRLKRFCPIMLLCNLDASKGLCNGTRMIVTEVQARVLKCKIISGDVRYDGNVVLIPRVSLDATDATLPVALRRRQFPVRLGFSMTINKSQGQSLQHVGINLQSAVFGHGQLYVGLSRCTSAEKIKVLLPDNNESKRTQNVVYKEILRQFEL